MENTPKSTVPSLVAGLTMVASAIVLKVFQFPPGDKDHHQPHPCNSHFYSDLEYG